MNPATERVKAYCVSVSMFIFTTPFATAVAISSGVDPLPPWKTRSSGFAPVWKRSAMPAWISPSSSGRSFTLPGLYTPCTLPKVSAAM